jgi:hypothetical protein
MSHPQREYGRAALVILLVFFLGVAAMFAIAWAAMRYG